MDYENLKQVGWACPVCKELLYSKNEDCSCCYDKLGVVLEDEKVDEIQKKWKKLYIVKIKKNK